MDAKKKSFVNCGTDILAQGGGAYGVGLRPGAVANSHWLASEENRGL